MLVLLSGPGTRPAELKYLGPPGSIPLQNLRGPVLLVAGEQDEIFSPAETTAFAAMLRTNGLSVDLQVIGRARPGWGLERETIFRCVGEYCLTHLAGKDAWRNYHSIAQWQAEVLPFRWFCLPATGWVVGWLIWSRRRKGDWSGKIKLPRREIVLRWLAALFATLILADTAIHLIPPRLAVSNRTLAVARRFLIQPKERADFEYLAAQPVWREQKLKVLLEHVELAGYNRELVNWQVDDRIYRDYVLSPVLEPAGTFQPSAFSLQPLPWRRPLWEEFYPRIRHDSSPEDAAKMVVRHLRERVTVADAPDLPQDVPAIWLRQITDRAGFEIIYVAALRSVGYRRGSTWSITPRFGMASNGALRRRRQSLSGKRSRPTRTGPLSRREPCAAIDFD